MNLSVVYARRHFITSEVSLQYICIRFHQLCGYRILSRSWCCIIKIIMIAFFFQTKLCNQI